MSSKPHKRPPGRPNRLGRDSELHSVRLRADQARAIRRLAGPAPGTQPDVIRSLLDAGLKATRAHVVRC